VFRQFSTDRESGFDSGMSNQSSAGKHSRNSLLAMNSGYRLPPDINHDDGITSWSRASQVPGIDDPDGMPSIRPGSPGAPRATHAVAYAVEKGQPTYVSIIS